MSERASFITQYVYCRKCFEALKTGLLDNHKYLCSLVIPSWEGEGKELPIIAGKIGGLGAGDDYITFMEIVNDLEPCHPVRIAFLGEEDNCNYIMFIGPEKEE